MQFIMVRWCAVLVAELCWVFCGPPLKTMAVLHPMHSTAAPHFTLTVKSDVVHLIVVCWVLLLQSFVAERIVHTRWPTEFFVRV